MSRKAVRMVASSEKVQQFIRNNLHLGARKRSDSMEQIRELTREVLVSYSGSEIVEYESHDGSLQQSIWFPANSEEPSPTVILFHGNSSRADLQIDNPVFNYYREKGFNILAVEYRGYGICEGVASTRKQEIQAYYDAEAAFRFLRDQKNIDPRRMLAHGVSLGGAYAAFLAQKVKSVVLDHTFSSFPAVASHASKIGLRSTIYICQKAFPHLRDGEFETDLFDNVRKVRNMEGELLVIRGEEDELMKLEFGDELIQSRYSEQEVQARRLLTIPGNHSQGFLTFCNEEYRRVFDRFLQESELT
ncbi:MAG: alpha/beta fold hydrolase [Chlamydiales bacterium]